jgi:hypothetical protein
MEEITLTEITNYIRTYMYEKSPGTFMILDLNSRKLLGANLTDAIIKKPKEVYKMMRSLYQDDITAKFIFKSMVVKPIAIKLGKIGLEEEVENALLSGCDGFIEYLKANGVNGKLDESICKPATSNSNAVSSLS